VPAFQPGHLRTDSRCFEKPTSFDCRLVRQGARGTSNFRPTVRWNTTTPCEVIRQENTGGGEQFQNALQHRKPSSLRLPLYQSYIRTVAGRQFSWRMSLKRYQIGWTVSAGKSQATIFLSYLPQFAVTSLKQELIDLPRRQALTHPQVEPGFISWHIPICAGNVLTLCFQILLRREPRIGCFPAIGRWEKGFSNKKGGNCRAPSSSLNCENMEKHSELNEMGGGCLLIRKRKAAVRFHT
jgi:hypothetical protein